MKNVEQCIHIYFFQIFLPVQYFHYGNTKKFVLKEFVDKDHVPEEIDLSKLPENVSQTLRIVRIGNYDTCACIGRHVANTAEIGIFKIISYDMENQRLRIRFKLLQE